MALQTYPVYLSTISMGREYGDRQPNSELLQHFMDTGHLMVAPQEGMGEGPAMGLINSVLLGHLQQCAPAVD